MRICLDLYDLHAQNEHQISQIALLIYVLFKYDFVIGYSVLRTPS